MIGRMNDLWGIGCTSDEVVLPVTWETSSKLTIWKHPKTIHEIHTLSADQAWKLPLITTVTGVGHRQTLIAKS